MFGDKPLITSGPEVNSICFISAEEDHLGSPKLLEKIER